MHEQEIEPPSPSPAEEVPETAYDAEPAEPDAFATPSPSGEDWDTEVGQTPPAAEVDEPTDVFAVEQDETTEEEPIEQLAELPLPSEPVEEVSPDSAPPQEEPEEHAEPAPVPREPEGTGLTDQDVDRIARRVLELAGGKLEQIAWEVIPDMAEIVVRQRVSELEKEADKQGPEAVQ